MRRGLSLALAAALLLSGCGALPRPREMGDMALLRVMGVDRGERGPAMSAATGPQAPEQPARLWQGEGSSLSAAAQAIQSRSDRYVFFGYVDQLLLGEDQSRRGVEDIFAYVARDAQLSLAARLWVVQDGEAHGALEAGGDQGVESRLATLAADGEMGLSIRPRRVGEVYAQLLEQGCSYAPALTVGEAELTAAGYAVFSGERLAGFLEGESARGLELLLGCPMAEVVEVPLPDSRAAVRITGAKTISRFGGPDGEIKLTCRVTAELAEGNGPLSETEQETVCRRLESLAEHEVTSALEQMRAWKADCAELGPRAALSDPGLWSSLESDWPEIFSRLEPELIVQADLPGG